MLLPKGLMSVAKLTNIRSKVLNFVTHTAGTRRRRRIIESGENSVNALGFTELTWQPARPTGSGPGLYGAIRTLSANQWRTAPPTGWRCPPGLAAGHYRWPTGMATSHRTSLPGTQSPIFLTVYCNIRTNHLHMEQNLFILHNRKTIVLPTNILLHRTIST
jgi:hypothetical protein